MDRRGCVLGCIALVGARAGARAQSRPRPIALLFYSALDDNIQRELIGPLRQGLAEHGLVEGRDIELHVRSAEGRPERIPRALDELLRLQPRVLVTSGPRMTLVARDAKVSVPVVAVAIDDPVQMGIAQSLARPGGHFTGLSAQFGGGGILERRLQLLADLVPAPRRFAVLANPLSLTSADLRRHLDSLEGSLGAPLLQVEAKAPADFDAAFDTLARQRINGLVVLADPAFYVHRIDLGARCQALKVPSVWGGRGYLEGGGLASFQGDFAWLFRRSAALIDKILKGTPPGEIPFEAGTKFELVLNLRAARALGLTIPARVRLSADEVIE